MLNAPYVDTEGEVQPGNRTVVTLSRNQSAQAHFVGVGFLVVTLRDLRSNAQAPEAAAQPDVQAMSPRDKQSQMNLVVVAVDDGPHSLSAFRKALGMLPRDTTHFHIVNVRPVHPDFLAMLSFLSPSTPLYAPVPTIAPPPPTASTLPSHSPSEEPETEYPAPEVRDYWTQLEDLRRAQCQAVLDKFRQLACHAGISFTVVELQGDAREELCDYCELHGAAVLVMGSRGNTLLQRLFLGSVSQYCIHHAPCAVMVDRCTTAGSDLVAAAPGQEAAAGS